MDISVPYLGAPVHPAGRLLNAFNRRVMQVTAAIAAFLVVAEAVILFAGVTSRYALGDPLTWTDELASTLFIWLAMLGAVLALDRGEHMRLTAIVSYVPERWRAWLEAVSAMVVFLFVGVIIGPATIHAYDQLAITTPSLEIPDGLRAAAVPVGMILMLLTAMARMATRTTLRQFGSAFAAVGAIAVVLWLGRPALLAMGNYNLVIFFVLLVGACVAGGIPIAFAFGVSTVAYLGLVSGAPMSIVVSRLDEGMSHLILLSVPLFILLGALIEASGLARTLIDFMASLLGHVRGGLEYVLLGAMFLVSGISGSKVADMAAVAPALFPEMKKRGAKPEELVALLSATGAMTETIPPSIVLITIGAVCGVSISALFISGLVPAAVATLGIVILCYFRARREPKPQVKRAPLATVARTLMIALPALALPVLIRYAVIEGAATATEVSTIGIVYTIFAGLAMHLFMRHIDFRRLYPILVETATLSGAILLVIGMATAMAWALTQSGFSAKLVGLMQGIPGGAAGFMVISVIAFIILGSVLEGIPAIVLFGPLLFPVARSLGIHDVHYSMVVILAMGIGLFAPPFGVGFYAACAIGKVSPDGVFSRVWGYLGMLVLALLVVAFFPSLSTAFLK
jgi:tripartite ATP-independent transporter DctM subunit